MGIHTTADSSEEKKDCSAKTSCQELQCPLKGGFKFIAVEDRYYGRIQLLGL